MQSPSDRKESDRVALAYQTASLAVSTALSGRVFYPGSPLWLGKISSFRPAETTAIA